MRVFEVTHVARDDCAVVMERRRGQKAVHDRQRGSLTLHLGAENAPAVRDGIIHRENAAGEAPPDIDIQPRFQVGPGAGSAGPSPRCLCGVPPE